MVCQIAARTGGREYQMVTARLLGKWAKSLSEKAMKFNGLTKSMWLCEPSSANMVWVIG
jgi:hypothetical protein